MSSATREPPPAGAPWDLPLAEAPIAFIDLEMTGLDVRKHRVIEVCIERWVGDRQIERMESLVRPEPLSEDVGNRQIHGIEADALRAAPTFSSLLPQITGLLEGAVLVAHGAKWDAAFLRAEMKRVGVSWSSEHHLDTLALSRRLMKQDSYRLAALAEALNIPNASHHRAGNDVAVTRQLFLHLLTLVSDPVPAVRVLWNRCVGRSSVDPGILDAAERAAREGKPTQLRYRASRRAPQQLEFVVTEVRRDLDPPVVLGYLHHTRGRRELRADRIMSLEVVVT